MAVHFAPAEGLYATWPAPVCVIVDGPYGVGGFPGDLADANGLAEWYRPHIREWTACSSPETTLWFWNTELGWATVHPVLVEYGWEYRSCHIWDKGLGHVAGNSNTATLRKFPVVTEVCVQYVLPVRFAAPGGRVSAQDWLRAEWKRTGLPYRAANDACGVSNAATRKYLTSDHHWYHPPPHSFARLVRHANENGDPKGRPYFSLDGREPLTAADWMRMRAKFRCSVGITNVWRHPQVSGRERIRGVRSRMKWKYRSLSRQPKAAGAHPNCDRGQHGSGRCRLGTVRRALSGRTLVRHSRQTLFQRRNRSGVLRSGRRAAARLCHLTRPDATCSSVVVFCGSPSR